MPDNKQRCDELLNELSFKGKGYELLGELLSIFHNRLTELEEKNSNHDS